MGTIHVGRPEFYPLPAAQLARLDRADAIVLEADVSDIRTGDRGDTEIRGVRRRRAGTRLGLPATLKARIETIATRNQIDVTPLWRMKPWMLANVLRAVRGGAGRLHAGAVRRGAI